MEVEVVIFQIIKWEERHKFFWNVDWKDDGEYDLLHFGTMSQYLPSWKNGLIGMFYYMFKRDKKGSNPMIDFIFDNNGGIWMKRPHDYKLGDIVKLHIQIMPTGKQDIKLVKRK